MTAVALTSVPHAGETYLRGETIEVSVTFSAPVTVSTVSGTPTIGLEVGTEIRQAAYARKAGPAVLVFDYPVREEDGDMVDGIAVPADGILLEGGTIVDAHGGAALLGHAAVAADAAHRSTGRMWYRWAGCASARRRCATRWWRRRRRTTRREDCSDVDATALAGITALQLHTRASRR